MLNTSRKQAIDYATSHDIIVKVMNPLCGGLLTGKSETMKDFYSTYEFHSMTELALSFILSEPNISPLVGVSCVDELELDLAIEAQKKWEEIDFDKVLFEFKGIIKTHETSKGYCTGCGYCMPCIKGIDIPKVLYFSNLSKFLNKSAWMNVFNENRNWGEPGYNIEDCLECGKCQERCTNKIKIIDEINNLKKLTIII